MKFLSLIIFSLYIPVCYAQLHRDSTYIRPEIEQIVSQITKGGMLEGERIGQAGTKSKQWDRFENLCKSASSKELKALTNNTNGVVRCYAFQALARRQDTAVFSILQDHLEDNQDISLMNYDVIFSKKVGDYFLDVLASGRVDTQTYKLSYIQQEQIDSILLYKKGIKLSAKNKLLINLKANSKYHNRIREIVVDERNPIAGVALARFQIQDDTSIISHLFDKEPTEYYAIYAAREFPDPVFYPKLVKVFDNEWRQDHYDYPKWRILYQALSKYPTSKTFELFEKTLKTKDNFRYNTLGKYLMIAITKYPNPYFEPLKSKIQLGPYYRDDVDREMNVEK